MVRTASAAEGGFPWPAEPLPVLRSIYQSPDSEPASEHISNKRMFYCLPSHHQYNTVRNSIQAYLDLWTVVHYKFLPIIHFSYAKFNLSQTAAEQTFWAIAQWQCLSAKPTLQSLPGLGNIICVLMVVFICSCKNSFLTVYHTMPICSCSRDVFLPLIWPHMPPVLP